VARKRFSVSWAGGNPAEGRESVIRPSQLLPVEECLSERGARGRVSRELSVVDIDLGCTYGGSGG
jgi:hypothetical protein